MIYGIVTSGRTLSTRHKLLYTIPDKLKVVLVSKDMSEF